MSRTDKTRPYSVKLAEVEQTNPYGIKREASIMWRHELGGCPLGRKCWACGGWKLVANSKTRREGKAVARRWAQEYGR